MYKKNKQIVQNPRNVYETNFILCLLLKYNFILPIQINLEKNKISLDKIFLCIQCIIIFFIIFDVVSYLYTFGLGLNDNLVNIIECIQNMFLIISIVILPSLGFFIITKLELFFNKILVFDKYFNEAECILLHKLTNRRHIYIFVLFFISQIHLMIFNLITLDYFIFYDVCFTYFTICFPVHNIFMVSYSHVNLVFLINERLQLLINKIEIKCQKNKCYFEKCSELLEELNIINALCDIMNEFNSNFGIIISNTIIAGFIAAIYFAYIIFNYFYYYPII